jgi:hypothetical protein
MLTALLYLALALGVLVLIVLAIVVASIRREPPATELSRRPPGPVSAVVRRLLGVSARRPGLRGGRPAGRLPHRPRRGW